VSVPFGSDADRSGPGIAPSATQDASASQTIDPIELYAAGIDSSDYVARVALHRDEIRSETNKLDWLFSTHTTSRSAAELLLFLHSGMMAAKGSARGSTVKAGRSA